MESRGSCGGPFGPGVAGGMPRRAWSRESGAMVDLPPVVTYETILGQMAPAEVLDGFCGPVDPVTGEREWVTADRCPLPIIDPDCPSPASSGFLSEACAIARELSAGLPSHWAPSSPSAALRSMLVVLKSEASRADAYRVSKDEDW